MHLGCRESTVSRLRGSQGIVREAVGRAQEARQTMEGRPEGLLECRIQARYSKPQKNLTFSLTNHGIWCIIEYETVFLVGVAS